MNITKKFKAELTEAVKMHIQYKDLEKGRKASVSLKQNAIVK